MGFRLIDSNLYKEESFCRVDLAPHTIPKRHTAPPTPRPPLTYLFYHIKTPTSGKCVLPLLADDKRNTIVLSLRVYTSCTNICWYVDTNERDAVLSFFPPFPTIISVE